MRRPEGAWVGAALVGALVLVGCGAKVPVRSHHGKPTPVVRETPSPFTSPVVPPGSQVLSCRLPVYGSAVVENPAGGETAGGFVSIPSGDVSPAEGTGITPVAGQFEEWQTETTPALYGDTAEESYDSVLGTWVPASPAELAPTGTQYAYVVIEDIGQPQTTPVYVHLVTIASASDTVIYSSGQTEVLGWAGSRILLVNHGPTNAATEGLLSLDPASAQITALEPDSSGIEWYLAAPHAVWGGQVNPADPAPPAVEVPQDEVLRYGLASGETTLWSYHPGDQVTVVGTTAGGDPVELVENTSQAVLEVATSPTASSTLLTGPGLASPRGLAVYSTYTDSHGTWIGTDQGLFLLTPTLQLVQEQAGNFANATIVGGCS